MAIALLLLSCGGSTPAQKAPAAGSTGAFGIVTVDGKQKMYLPLPAGQIAVVDVGLAGNGTAGAPAQMALIDLAGEVATATGGDETVVVAASTAVPKVWFIDPRADKLVKTITLQNADTSSFSGGGGYVTGIAVDSAHRRAVLSVWNGFAIVDLDSQEIVQTIAAAPSENFGYDSSAQRIIAPFYGCPSTVTVCQDYKTPAGDPISDGLNVIDLADNAVYTYQDATAANPAAPVGGEPDSAAADPVSGFVVVPSEADGFTTLLDVGHATFDKAKKTFTAPHRQLETSSGLTGVAAEPDHHLALWEAEWSSSIAVADLSQENQGRSTLVAGDMPSQPGGSGWSNIGDPHGIAVTAAIRDGRPVGFLVNGDRTWVARIDLAGLLAAPHTAGTPLTGEQVAPFVTFLDASKKP